MTNTTNAIARQQTFIVPGFIDNCESKRILIDTGAAKDILFYSVYQKMGLPELEPADELIEIDIHPDYHEQKIKLESQLTTEERDEIITLFKHNLDIFAWRVEDMKGIREDVHYKEKRF